MRYKKALEFMEKFWPNLAAWVEEQIGPRDANNGDVNTALAVASPPGAGPDHIFLVQSGILYWYASGKPLNQPQNNWPGKDQKAIQTMFQTMKDGDIIRWLQGQEKTFTPAPPPPSLPPRRPPSPLPPRQDVQIAQPQSVPPRRVPPPPPPSRSPQLNVATSIPSVSGGGGLPASLLQATPPPPPRTTPFVAMTGRAPVAIFGQPYTPPPPRTAIVTPQVVDSGRSVPVTVPPPPPRQGSPVPVPLAVRPRRASLGPVLISKDVKGLMTLIEAMGDLKDIFVCDIPTGAGRGAYLTEVSTSSPTDQAKIMLRKRDNPDGWLRLGQSVLTNRMGKCFSCSAAVIYKLVRNAKFDKIRIESIGSSDYDHHFVVINRHPSTAIDDITSWNKEAILIDVWQANLAQWLNVRPGTPKTTKLSYSLDKTIDKTEFPYKTGIVLFCSFEPGDRKEHADSVSDVGKALHTEEIAESWRKLGTCFVEHLSRGRKVSGCTVSGFCDKKS